VARDSIRYRETFSAKLPERRKLENWRSSHRGSKDCDIDDWISSFPETTKRSYDRSETRLSPRDGCRSSKDQRDLETRWSLVESMQSRAQRVLRVSRSLISRALLYLCSPSATVRPFPSQPLLPRVRAIRRLLRLSPAREASSGLAVRRVK